MLCIGRKNLVGNGKPKAQFWPMHAWTDINRVPSALKRSRLSPRGTCEADASWFGKSPGKGGTERTHACALETTSRLFDCLETRFRVGSWRCRYLCGWIIFAADRGRK